MNKVLLQLSAFVFTAALTGMLACSSDPNSGGGGCGGGAAKAPLDCPRGSHQDGKTCKKNKAKPATTTTTTPASVAPPAAVTL